MMKKVALFDNSNNQMIELSNSSVTIISRELLKCTDKRVSRNHGEITVLEKAVKIKACHNNPIFYTFAVDGSNHTLHKGSEVTLIDSDKFSLLPNNEYEYQIKVTENLAGTQATTSEQLRVRNILEINDRFEAGNMGTTLSQIVGDTAAGSDTTNDVNRVSPDLDRTSSPDRTPSPDMLVPPPSFVTNSTQDSPTNSRKRSIDENSDNDENRKRQKSEAAPSVSSNNENNEIPTTTMTIKPDPDSASHTEPLAIVTISQSAVPAVVNQDSSGSLPVTSSVVTVKTEKTIDSKAKVKTEAAATPSAQPAAAAAPALRPSCEHGIRCYRNTPEHKREFAHPLETDYRRPNYPPASVGTPPCPWGAACYRRNPDHFRSLQHPPSTVYSVQPVSVPQNNQAAQNAAAHRHSDDEEDNEDDFDDSDVDMDFTLGDDDENESASDGDDGEDNNLEE